MTKKTTVPEPPVHLLSTIVTLVLDYMWAVPEFGILALRSSRITAPVMIILMLALGVICFFAVFLVQYFVAHDTFGPAFAKAFVMSVVAAVPYPVISTVIGIVLLGWAGVHFSETQIRKLFTS
jgi:hypothetical protein